jgi:flagellar biosynthesis/type III secretory pathway protein FliH
MIKVLKRPAEARGSLRLPARGEQRTQPRTTAGSQEAKPVVPAAAAPAPAIPKEELQALREQAFREGLAEGRRAAEQEQRAALEQHAQLWRQSLQNFEKVQAQQALALEQLAVQIGFEALCHLLGEAYARGAGVAGTVQRLLREAAEGLQLTVHVAPDQVELVRAALAQDPVVQHRRIRFEVDPALAPAACRISSERGMLESDLQLQLQAVQDALVKAHQARRTDAA